jgi:mannose-6-phosphate isomerase-like protein (cupin superfamily)
MSAWHTKRLPERPDVLAPDGSDVRILLSVGGGSMAHFELGPGKTSAAVVHRTVEEIWLFLGGRGEMWRAEGDRAEVVEVAAGVCVTIPVGVRFQFRSLGGQPLTAVGATIPPWPGPGEAEPAEGPWAPTVAPGQA